MLNACYLKIMEKVAYLQAELDLLMKYAQDNTSFEDRQARNLTENLIESMKATAYELLYLSSPAVEGKLIKDKTKNRFELVCDEDGNLPRWPFYCGDRLEILGNDGKWHFGKVKNTRNEPVGFYLDNSFPGYPVLFDGMRGRVRREA